MTALVIGKDFVTFVVDIMLFVDNVLPDGLTFDTKSNKSVGTLRYRGSKPPRPLFWRAYGNGALC